MFNLDQNFKHNARRVPRTSPATGRQALSNQAVSVTKGASVLMVY